MVTPTPITPRPKMARNMRVVWNTTGALKTYTSNLLEAETRMLAHIAAMLERLKADPNVLSVTLGPHGDEILVVMRNGIERTHSTFEELAGGGAQ